MGAPNENPNPSPGEALKKTQTGHLPTGSVEHILKKAPEDIVTKVIDVPEWECSITIRSFTAAQSAMIREKGIAFKGEETEVAWAEMEILQFHLGVIDPTFTEEQARELHLTSGTGFALVITEMDKLSKLNKEEIAKAREDFRKQSESAAV